jgi:SmpA / OmlA family
MNMSPNVVKRGSSFNRDQALRENYKQRELDAASRYFNRLPLVRSGSFFRLISRFVLVLLLVLGVSCVGRRLTKANVDEVTEGMSKKQVESILGPPTTIDNKDFIVMKKTTYVYRQGQDTVTVVFKDDKVTDKQSTVSD